MGNQEVVSHETQAALDIRQQLFDVHYRGIGGGRDSTVAYCLLQAAPLISLMAQAQAASPSRPLYSPMTHTLSLSPSPLPTTQCPINHNGLSAQLSKACPDG